MNQELATVERGGKQKMLKPWNDQNVYCAARCA
jgi:hypothetical protein